MRFLSGMLASLLVMPAWASGSWWVVLETPAEVVAIDLSDRPPTACAPCAKFWRSG